MHPTSYFLVQFDTHHMLTQGLQLSCCSSSGRQINRSQASDVGLGFIVAVGSLLPCAPKVPAINFPGSQNHGAFLVGLGLKYSLQRLVRGELQQNLLFVSSCIKKVTKPKSPSHASCNFTFHFFGRPPRFSSYLAPSVRRLALRCYYNL